MTVSDYLKKLIDIPSPTGEEARLCRQLQQDLQAWGFETGLQKVDAGRCNLFALSASEPEVLISSHLDTVQPFFAASEQSGRIYGRGACDAKGQIAAAVFAVKNLPQIFRRRVGLLFVVGEETDSIGAKTAVKNALTCRFILNCEPTGNKLAAGQCGFLAFKLTVQGKAAHSGYPGNGDSAIEKIVQQLAHLQKYDWGIDEKFGRATFNPGKIKGGTAANVIAAEAEAECSVRVVTSCDNVQAQLELLLMPGIEVQISARSEPVQLFVPPGFAAATVRFGSDAVHFSKAYQTLMLGPGSILNAHTKDEFIEVSELEDAVKIYQNLLETLLSMI